MDVVEIPLFVGNVELPIQMFCYKIENMKLNHKERKSYVQKENYNSYYYTNYNFCHNKFNLSEHQKSKVVSVVIVRLLLDNIEKMYLLLYN